MTAKADGTGEPSLFQMLRGKIASLILGKVMWQWQIRRSPLTSQTALAILKKEDAKR